MRSTHSEVRHKLLHVFRERARPASSSRGAPRTLARARRRCPGSLRRPAPFRRHPSVTATSTSARRWRAQEFLPAVLSPSARARHVYESARATHSWASQDQRIGQELRESLTTTLFSGPLKLRALRSGGGPRERRVTARSHPSRAQAPTPCARAPAWFIEPHTSQSLRPPADRPCKHQSHAHALRQCANQEPAEPIGLPLEHQICAARCGVDCIMPQIPSSSLYVPRPSVSSASPAGSVPARAPHLASVAGTVAPVRALRRCRRTLPQTRWPATRSARRSVRIQADAVFCRSLGGLRNRLLCLRLQDGAVALASMARQRNCTRRGDRRRRRPRSRSCCAGALRGRIVQSRFPPGR